MLYFRQATTTTLAFGHWSSGDTPQTKAGMEPNEMTVTHIRRHYTAFHSGIKHGVPAPFRLL